MQSTTEHELSDINEIQTETRMQTATENDVFNLNKIETGAELQPTFENEVFGNMEHDLKSGDKYDIILNAYKHSGSTATGRILGSRMDTFYVHEPLWQVATRTFYKGPCLFCKDFPLDIQNSSCINADKNCYNKNSVMEEFLPRDYGDHVESKVWGVYYKSLQESSAFLQSILDCDFHRFQKFFYDATLPSSQKATIQTIFYHDFGWSQFKVCREKKNVPFSKCLALAEKSCRSAKHRVIKLLRMTLDNLAPLLKRNPRLKVIHLFRDPRGIFNSMVGTSLYPMDDKTLSRIRNVIKTMCERLRIDIEASKMLKMIYPERVKVVQYEHLYDRPLPSAAKDLYAFAGMEYGSKQQAIIRTNFNKRSGGAVGFHPFNYRTKLPWSVIKLFNEECSEVLDRLGYTRYTDKGHLNDLSRPGFAAGVRS